MVIGNYITDKKLLENIQRTEEDLCAFRKLIEGCSTLEKSEYLIGLGKHHYFHVKKSDFLLYENECVIYLRELYQEKKNRGL